ncbi:MCE family protein [Tomitella cavernea]|uniref:MCE family protein n=1 Tax=Tomitella cavernea TaxID=1387982 RepID=A0ABP9CDU3_9ACTN|nr:MCE family protein [Tomitella cavernea]
MRNRHFAGRRLIAATALGCAALLASGCTWNGLNSLPLPGTVGTGDDAYQITAVVPNVGTLTQNSPVMIDDVTVGSIRKITADENWNARVTIGLEAGTKVPRGTRAMVGQASLLGSQYLELDPPEGGGAGSGYLGAGDVIPLQRGGRFPSTEQTLSTLSVVLNGGGLAQLQDITTELNAALGGNENSLHDLIPRLNDLVSTLDEQRGDIVAAMDGVDRLSATVNEQNDVLADALTGLEPATRVLADQKDTLTDAIVALGNFSAKADTVLTESGSDLRSLTADLKPILGALADAGKKLPETLSLLFTFPFPMETLFNAMRGDYTNLWDEVDLTGQRIQRSLLVGSPAQPWSDTDWAKKMADAGGDIGDPFNPRMPDPAAVEAPGGAPAKGGEGSVAAPAPQEAPAQSSTAQVPNVEVPNVQVPNEPAPTPGGDGQGAGAAPPVEPEPVFDAPVAELFGPPATGEDK